jgi:type I restriction enzyme S subunit
MTATFNPYPKYKPSGVEWLGDIPEHWEMTPNRGFIKPRKDLVGEQHSQYTLLSLTLNGVIPRDMENPTGKFPAEFNSYQKVFPGDLVFCLFDMDETPRTVGLSPIPGMITGAYAVFEPRDKDIANFLYRFYLAMDDGKYLKPLYSGLRKTITKTRFLGVRSPMPPAEERATIANFLDEETRKIDETVKELEKSITLLEEEKICTIHELVTGKVNPETGNPYPKSKASGVLWLGDIPEHWGINKLSRLFKYSKGSKASLLTKEYIGGNSGPYPVFSGQTENGGLMGEINWHEFDFHSPVVFVTTVGARAMTTRLVSGQFSLSQNCALLIPRADEVLPEFYEPTMQCLFDYERKSISLIMQPSLRFEDLNKMYVPQPSHEDQVLIAKHIQQKTGDINSLISEKESLIESLKEYRTSLTHEAVTGKIDLRKA